MLSAFYFIFAATEMVNKSEPILDLSPGPSNSEVTPLSRDSTNSDGLSPSKLFADEVHSFEQTSSIYFHRDSESGLVTQKNSSVVTDNQRARDSEDQDVDYVEVWLDPDKLDDVGAIVDAVCETTHLSPELSHDKSNQKKRKVNKTKLPSQSQKIFGSKIRGAFYKSKSAYSQYQKQFSTGKTFSHQRERNNSSMSINSNEEESVRAERHNRSERERRNSMKNDFDQLSRVLPLDCRTKNPRISILHVAQERIKYLEEEGKSLTEELEYQRSVFNALHLRLAKLKEERMFSDPLQVAKLREQLFAEPLSQRSEQQIEEENSVGISFPMESSSLQHWSNDPYLFKKEQNIETLGEIFDETPLLPT